MGEEKQFGGRKKRKRRRKGEKGKEKKRKEKRKKERKEKKKEKRKGFRFSMFRRSEVVSSRIKVGLLDKSYE